MSSPTWPVDMPGAVRTQRQGFPDEFLPNGAGIVLFENHWPPSGHCFVVVFHQVSVRERVRSVPRLAAVPERGELLSLCVVGVALERLVGLRVVEAQGGEDAGLEHGLRPDRRVDGQVSVSLQSWASARAVVVEREPRHSARDRLAELFTSTTAPAFPLVPTNAWCAAWVPLYLHGLCCRSCTARASCAWCCCRPSRGRS